MSTKRVLIACLSILAVATLAIGGTLAWMNTNTNVVDNVFTLAKTGGEDAAMQALIVETFDPEDAQNLVPSDSVQKVLTVENTSTKAIDVWVAVMLTFEMVDPEGSPADMQTLNNVIELQLSASTAGTGNVFGADWVRKNTGALKQNEIFYYNTKLAKDDVTTSLIDKVNILASADNEDIDTINEWKGFNIKASGAIVQGDASSELTQEEIRAALDALLN